MNYDNVCFVVMPFGRRQVGPNEVDFDWIYENVFVRAIGEVVLPEKGNLEPRRTDHDYHAALIDQDMFEYLEYSRFVVADITGLNPNVFYELGHRHRARATGTVVFRQKDAPIPFDINQVKVFEYGYDPEAAAAQARADITRVLTRSAGALRLDSPIRRAIHEQQSEGIDGFLREADNAVRQRDSAGALGAYFQAAVHDPKNAIVQQKLGLLTRDSGDWVAALERFTRAADLLPGYAEALREKGIAENKVWWQRGCQPGEPTGEESLRLSIELAPDNFDAWASLGGVLKRAKRLKEALDCYDHSVQVSRGHPYPLLNALTLRAHVEGRLSEGDDYQAQLESAAQIREGQLRSIPPVDLPWSGFDVAQIRLFQKWPEEFLKVVRESRGYANAGQLETFRKTLELLEGRGLDLPGLSEGIQFLRTGG